MEVRFYLIIPDMQNSIFFKDPYSYSICLSGKSNI